ncbi:DUF4082 domain-containing protein [Niabella ginsengisoli]|uniref:DUF4082 domain-containing protein n=1 Tax=Niabella ginsengisoli TaxID=522298 RepID=A0ABS9SPE0_9BACT|nr:DUF4082 domain-containing protein [Niabella ginsengisoli]MCH5600278.1 DUF4082 domain-containing protein [Niabella ginsengisoli]
MKSAIFAVLVACLVMSSCTKDQIKSYPEEDPLLEFLAVSGFSETTARIVNSGNYEFGITFTSKVNGMIKAIRIKIPDNATNIRVTFWDASNQEVIRTETVNNVSNGIDLVHDIQSLPIEMNKRYTITFNSDDWYIRKRVDDTPAMYPITVGNITIESYGSGTGRQQVFPTLTSTSYYAGDLFSFSNKLIKQH